MSDTNLHKGDLGEISFLAGGGTARVYRISQQDIGEAFPVVYKEYKESTRRRAGPGLLPGLWQIVRIRSSLEAKQRRFFDERTIWPIRIVTDNDGAVTGILMRLIPEAFFQHLSLPSGEVKQKPREVQFLFLGEDDGKRVGVSTTNFHDRISVCAQIARAFGLLHHAEVVFGDISARNIVYDIGPRGDVNVLLVDCDSVRVKGTRSPFGAQPHTPRWEPPEALEAKNKLGRAQRAEGVPASVISDYRNRANVQSKATDVYKYGLLVLRVLDFGRSLSANRNPQLAAKILDAHVGVQGGELLRASLCQNPEDRPTMREWYEGVVGKQSRNPVIASDTSNDSVTTPSSVPAVSANWTLVDGVGWRRVKS
jgi:hypothetical protein